MTTEKLSALDEAIILSERRWPMTITFEANCNSSVKTEDLEYSIRKAVTSLPKLTQHLRSFNWSDRALSWSEFPYEFNVPLTVTSCSTIDLPKIREQFINQRFDLVEGPLFRLLLAEHDRQTCSIMFAVHHGLTDAYGAWQAFGRILQSCGAEIPPTSEFPFISEEFPIAEDTKTEKSRIREGFLSVLRRNLNAIVLVLAGSGKTQWIQPSKMQPKDFGFHCEYREFDENSTKQLRQSNLRLEHRLTLNDIFVSNLHRTISKWNTERGNNSRPISITVPISIRTPDQALLGNYTTHSSTIATPSQIGNIEQLVVSIKSQTQAAKASPLSNDPSSSISSLRWFPLAIRSRLPSFVSFITRDRFLDTARLSNLGRIDVANSGINIKSVWWTAPVRMPQGLTLAIAEVDGKISLGFRCCSALFDTESLRCFVDDYCNGIRDFIF